MWDGSMVEWIETFSFIGKASLGARLYHSLPHRTGKTIGRVRHTEHAKYITKTAF